MKYLGGILVILLWIGQAQAQDDTRPTQPDLPGDLMFDFGFSYWSKKLDQLPVRVIGSNAVGLYYNRRMEINDHLSFHPALGFGFDKYAFSDDYTWRNEAGLVVFDTLDQIKLDKNKLIATYFEAPIEFRIHPLGTIEGEGWFIGIGGVAGWRLGSHTKIKYDTNGDTHKEKTYDDFGLKKYRYAAQVRFGFRFIHLYYRMYFSDLFDSAPEISGRIPRASTIGINISGF